MRKSAEEVDKESNRIATMIPDSEVRSFAGRVMKDADGIAANGTISKTEMLVSLGLKEEHKEFLAWIIHGHPCRFDSYDVDGSGNITIKELITASRDFLREDLGMEAAATPWMTGWESDRSGLDSMPSSPGGSIYSDRGGSKGKGSASSASRGSWCFSPSGLNLSRPTTAGGGTYNPQRSKNSPSSSKKRASTAKPQRRSPGFVANKKHGMTRPSTAPPGSIPVGGLSGLVRADSSQQEIGSIAAEMQGMSAAELRNLSFTGATKLPEPPLLRKKPRNTWAVGIKTSKQVSNAKDACNPAVKSSWRRWKAPPGSVRQVLQQPMDKPHDMPKLLWKHFHGEYTRIATTPRDRMWHMSTLGITDPKKAGFILDSVASSWGNGVDRRFRNAC